MSPSRCGQVPSLLALCFVLASCDRAILEGTVVDVQGEGLPGVSVHIEGSDRETVTNAHGEYRVRHKTDSLILSFAKTGYTPGRLALEARTPEIIQVTRMELWRLPPRPGVFLYENHRYSEADTVEPSQFFLKNGTMAYATPRLADTVSTQDLPLIICFKTPRYDARLSRLSEVEARMGVGGVQKHAVWAPVGTLPAALIPIDEAERMLLQLRLEGPLEEGVYAVHWGALEGRKDLEKRIFLFRVSLPRTHSTAAVDSGAIPVHGGG